MRKRLEVKAVWDKDLEDLLKSLGIWEQLASKELLCDACRRKIDINNFGAVFNKQGEIGVCCDNEHCVRLVTKKEVTESSE